MAADTGRPALWPTLVKLLLALVATGVLVAGMMMPAILGSGLVGKDYAAKFLNTSCNLAETKPPEPTTLYARDRTTVIARLFTQDRKQVTLDKVPKYLQDALIATEDRRFYSHHGVDLRGLVRSAISTTSGDTQGGSTLTMQYVKQMRYYQAGDNLAKQRAAIAQTINRKLEDAKCAIDIEKRESKATILDNYLNIAFFGEHAYGIERAAEVYFGKSVTDLTLAQSATLVGLLRAPSDYDPFVHPEASRERRNEVLQNLVSVGKLSQQAADAQKATPIALATKTPPTVHEGCSSANTNMPNANAAFFCTYAQHWLLTTGGIDEQTLSQGGLKIITTLDPALQTSMQARLQKEVPASSAMTAVMPAVDPRTGDVLAMAASKTYGLKKGQTEQDLFTSYTADGASTFKLFPLLAALSIGVPEGWKLTTVGSTGTYKPTECATSAPVRNGDENISYNATETLKTAMAKSSNTFFVGLADQLFGCHLQPTIDLMRKLGMASIDQPSGTPNRTYAQLIAGQERAQQLVLGSVPTSPLELAGAYAAVANGGKYNAPAPILSITDNHGQAVQVKRTPGVQVISAWAAAKATDVLTGETKGSGSSAKRFTSWYDDHDSDIAGKTGTNQAGNSAKYNAAVWFVGMTPSVTATTALIDFDQSTVPSTGLPGEGKGKAYGDYAAKVWLNALQPSIAKQSWSWDQAENVNGSEVPDVTNKSMDAATSDLKDHGFKVAVLDQADGLQCASDVDALDVAFYGPHIAPKGSTITLCQSSGAGQHVVNPVVYKPPTRTTTTRNNNTTRNTHTGSTHSPAPTHTTPTHTTKTHSPGH